MLVASSSSIIQFKLPIYFTDGTLKRCLYGVLNEHAVGPNAGNNIKDTDRGELFFIFEKNCLHHYKKQNKTMLSQNPLQRLN